MRYIFGRGFSLSFPGTQKAMQSGGVENGVGVAIGGADLKVSAACGKRLLDGVLRGLGGRPRAPGVRATARALARGRSAHLPSSWVRGREGAAGAER